LITIQESELKERVLSAVKRAKELGQSILFSEVHKIEPVDPLLFFHIGKEKYIGERFFWKDPADQIMVAGLGISKQIQSDQATDRFFLVEKKWKKFVENSFIYNPYKDHGIGPLMFGGFSFDPLKGKTELWSKFADSLFHLPKFMLTNTNGATYLTTNIVCTVNDDETLFNKMVEERNEIIDSFSQGFQTNLPQLVKTNEISPDNWKKSVDDVVNTLKTGEMKKVVLARELRLFFNEPAQAEAVLLQLSNMQHDSFIFAFESNGDCFVGASPERLVKKQEDDVFSTCLAGSISRGKTDEEDRHLGQQLLNDRKNLMEHGYVVEMIKEALEECCSEVILPDKPQLMKIRDIQHLYTPVIGKCDKEASILRLVERLHPTPALGGLPKKEAVEKIREVEELDRGFYAAPLGWFDYQGNGEFAVAIRSGLIQGKEASLFAGCGVVADSDSESEYLETSLKFRPMLRALGGK
jgi:menaquinone-specific isochorismate synthase